MHQDFEHWTRPVLIFHADELDQKLGREHIQARQADLSVGRWHFLLIRLYLAFANNLVLIGYFLAF